MEEHHKKIEVKLRLLNLATKDIDLAIQRRNEREIKRKEKVMSDAIEGIHYLKYEVIEDKLMNDVSQEDIKRWTDDLEENTSKYEMILDEMKKGLVEKKEEEKERTEQRLEEEMKIREIRNDMEIRSMGRKGQSEVMSAKLPKLQISKFKGSHLDWTRFWNQFKAEIDSTNISSITKFSYLKEMMSPQATSLINGLPFSAEGYERAKLILKDKYGKTSEVINAHVQEIMNLTTVSGNNPGRVIQFYEKPVIGDNG